LLILAVDHGFRRRFKVGCQNLLCAGVNIGSLECRIHQFEPVAARQIGNGKRSVAHAQSRMPTLLNILGRPSEPIDKKSAKALGGPGQIRRRVHGAKHFVGRNLTIECVDETAESVVAKNRVNLVFLHEAMLALPAERAVPGITGVGSGLCYAIDRLQDAGDDFVRIRLGVRATILQISFVLIPDKVNRHSD
jgi:hypothetical protein